MYTEDDIDEELNGICSRQNPFGVSAGYFSEREQKTLLTAFLEDFKDDKNTSGFSVPVNYFEDLAGKISTGVLLEDHKENAFAVPVGYFELLEQRIKTKVEPGKNKMIVRRLFGGRTWQYATAACLVMALGSSLWFTRNSTNYSVQNELSSLPDTDIESYLEDNTGSSDINLLMENMDHEINVTSVSKQVDPAILKNYIETQL